MKKLQFIMLTIMCALSSFSVVNAENSTNAENLNLSNNVKSNRRFDLFDISLDKTNTIITIKYNGQETLYDVNYLIENMEGDYLLDYYFDDIVPGQVIVAPVNGVIKYGDILTIWEDETLKCFHFFRIDNPFVTRF